ncbi:MAG: GLPGLI family protein [Rhodothermales bacterium]|nr:GLPGLI family protein [Rhodothermales bacterium]MBO6779274.1 GLPGLI family protein [Rhodothermales bacterium]
MKSIVSLLAALLLPMAAFAQQGAVRYDATIKLDIQLPPGMEEMAAQIPDSQTSGRMLYFTEAATLMKDAPKAESDDDGPIEIGGDNFQFRLDNRRPEQETYISLEDGSMIDKREFMGRKFRVMDQTPEYSWRLTGEQSEYMGYAMMKAVGQRDTTVVEAWFTPDIPVSAGPDGMGGLPGLILVASVDEGRRTYTATSVDLEMSVAGMITPPKGGREVTREEFDAIVEEKMKEMNAQRSGSGGMRVMIRH